MRALVRPDAHREEDQQSAEDGRQSQEDGDPEESPSPNAVAFSSRRANSVELLMSVLGIVESSQHLGTATGALLVISTLTFGFAIAALIDIIIQQASDSLLTDTLVVLLLSCSSMLAVVTTVFGLLEYYYIEMVSGADSRFRQLDNERSDRLECEFKEVLVSFNNGRARARNAMWASLISIQVAAGVQLNRDLMTHMNLNPKLPEWAHLVGRFLASVVQFAGSLFVIVTVRTFRRTFRPLLHKYKLSYR